LGHGPGRGGRRDRRPGGHGPSAPGLRILPFVGRRLRAPAQKEAKEKRRLTRRLRLSPFPRPPFPADAVFHIKNSLRPLDNLWLCGIFISSRDKYTTYQRRNPDAYQTT